MGWQPRLVNLPQQAPSPRTQCPACVGGGEINDLLCGTCGGRGWHDAANPPPERINLDREVPGGLAGRPGRPR